MQQSTAQLTSFQLGRALKAVFDGQQPPHGLGYPRVLVLDVMHVKWVVQDIVEQTCPTIVISAMTKCVDEWGGCAGACAMAADEFEDRGPTALAIGANDQSEVERKRMLLLQRNLGFTLAELAFVISQLPECTLVIPQLSWCRRWQ